MHRCLQIAEIQDVIVQHTSRGTDLALVLACRTLYESAMNAIWEDLAGYAPLVKCMPTEVWTERDVNPEYPGLSSHVVFNREPTATEWQKFRKHAHRARRFGLEGTTVYYTNHGYNSRMGMRSTEPSTLDTIDRYVCSLQAEGLPPLFPQLVCLRTRDQTYAFKNPRIFRSLSYLAGQGLRFFISLGTSIEDRTACEELIPWQTSFALLATAYPNLRRLQMTTFISGIYSFLTRFPHLENVQAVIPVNMAGTCQLLAHLTALTEPGLSYLSLDQLDISDDEYIGTAPLTCPTCPSLVNLLLTCLDMAHILYIMEAVRGSTKLQVVLLQYRGVGAISKESMDILFSAVSQTFSIESFSFIFSSPHALSPAVTSSHISAVYSLHRLRIFRLLNLSRVVFTDTDLAALADACPCLEKLECLSDDNITSAVTLGGVASLRNRCPALKVITLDVGHISEPGLRAHTPENVRMLQPLQLTLGGLLAEVCDPEWTARNVRILFPRLDRFIGIEVAWIAVQAVLEPISEYLVESEEDDTEEFA